MQQNLQGNQFDKIKNNKIKQNNQTKVNLVPNSSWRVGDHQYVDLEVSIHVWPLTLKD